MFDPYYKWLGIPPKDQPPNHYRLLAIELFEDNSDVIDAAANRQMAYLQQRATGKHSADSQRLLNEVAAARLCLLKQKLKTKYDLQLRQQLSPPETERAKQRSLTEHANSSKSPRVLSRSKNSKRSPATSIMERTDKRTLLKVAVGVGTVGLLLIGYAVSGPGTVDRSQNERSNVGASETDDNQTKASSNLPSATDSQEAVSSKTGRENPDAKKIGTYTVNIQPSEAHVTAEGGGILVTGEGRQRKITVSESSQALSFVLTASRLGFKEYTQTIPITTDDKILNVRLEPLPVGEIRSIQADQGQVFAVVFSRDGRWFASSGAGSSIKDWGGSLLKLWDTQSGAERMRFRGHNSGVSCLAVSPDGSTLASGSWDKTVRLWDLVSGKTTSVLKGHTHHVMAVAFTPNGKAVIGAGKQDNSDDEAIRVWNLSDQSVSKSRITPQHALPSSLVVHPDGKRAFFVSRDVRVLGITTTHISKSFQGHKAEVRCVAVSPDGRYCISGSAPSAWDQQFPFDGDSSLRMWDCDSGREVRRFQAEQFRPYCIAFSPNGKSLLTGDYWHIWGAEKPDPSIGCSVRLWDVSTGKELYRFKGHKDTITSVVFSPDGKIAASASYDGTVRLWRMPTDDEVRSRLAKVSVTTNSQPSAVKSSERNAKPNVSKTTPPPQSTSNAGNRGQSKTLTALETKFIGRYRSLVVKSKPKSRETYDITVKADRSWWENGKKRGEWKGVSGRISFTHLGETFSLTNDRDGVYEYKDGARTLRMLRQ